MNNTFASRLCEVVADHEPHDWCAFRQLQADVDSDALSLLSKSAAPRPGNERYALVGGRAWLLAELRQADRQPQPQLLQMPASDCDQQQMAPLDDLVCGLAESGYSWSPANDEPGRWQAVASDSRGFRSELSAEIVPNGVQVRGELGRCDAGIGPASERALARYLMAAHSRVRFARFLLDGRGVAAVSFAAAVRLEIELPDSVLAVAAACRLVWREVGALFDEQVARVYLEVTEESAARPAGKRQ